MDYYIDYNGNKITAGDRVLYSLRSIEAKLVSVDDTDAVIETDDNKLVFVKCHRLSKVIQ
jgi:preprotein translocase subunit YajC